MTERPIVCGKRRIECELPHTMTPTGRRSARLRRLPESLVRSHPSGPRAVKTWPDARSTPEAFDTANKAIAGALGAQILRARQILEDIRQRRGNRRGSEPRRNINLVVFGSSTRRLALRGLPAPEARRLAQRIEGHYTLMHGSWPDTATAASPTNKPYQPSRRMAARNTHHVPLHTQGPRCLTRGQLLANTNSPFGGIVSAAEFGRPCMGEPFGSTSPLFPQTRGLTQLS
jgi:hypothetical protein